MADNGRRSSRHRCKVRVQIRARGSDYLGYVLDISDSGLRLSTDEVAEIWTGDNVEVVSEEFGLLMGRTQWRRPGALGIRFDDSTNTSAKFQAFRKSLQQ